MKSLVTLSLFVCISSAFAETKKTEKKTTNPVPGPAEVQEQQEETKEPVHPFKLGPYKDGAYQFWGKEDLKERDEREEAGQ